jgi:deoxycytidine triphosphate deaminase
VSNLYLLPLEWVTNTELFNRKIQGSAVDIRTDFMVYKNEHNRLIDALAKAKGISIAQLGRRCISLV